jgi:phenylacetate-CoA ligase
MAHGNVLTRYIYKHSPWMLQNLLASFYSYLESSHKYGKSYNQYFEYLNKTQLLNLSQLKILQVEKLKRIIEYAAANVPYYTEMFKKLNVNPNDISSVADLGILPILSKDEVRMNFKKLISKEYMKKEYLIGYTSGTTGKPLKLAFSKESYQKEQAYIWFHRSWGGANYKEKTATFAGHMVIDIKKDKPPFWVENRHENQIIFSSYHMNLENLKFYVEKLIRFKPELIWGYPSSIYLLASFVEQNYITDINPKAIFTSSETLLDFQREKIEKAFKSKVFDYYGNSEMTAKILECEEGGLHIQHDYSIVEFLDYNDFPVKNGQEGRMICTGFMNFAMPLIRYDTGDLAIPTNRACSCGRQSQLVDKIVGRIEDFIITPQGRLIGRLGGLIFREIKNVQEAQILQEDKNTLIVKIVRLSGYTNKDSKQIISTIQMRVGPDMNIKLEFVDHIPRLANGKFKFVLSKIPSHI